MPKGEYQFDASNPKLKDFYEDIYSHLPADILQEFAATMSAQHSIFELQALCEKHTEMGEVIKTYAMRPLIQKEFGEKALAVYDKLIQQDNHKDLSLSKFYQICKKLKEEMEQLREFINSEDMKFATALADWPEQSAAELNDLNNFFDNKINEHYQALIAYLAQPGLQDLHGRAPLNWAADRGYLATVKALLAYPGIDVNKADNYGRTPLFWATVKDHSEVVKELLDKSRIDVNKASNNGFTPLAWAAFYGYLETVKTLLVRQDIEVNKADNDGDTPLTWAEAHGYEEIALLIKNHIASKSNSATDSLAAPGYAALRNQGAASNGADIRSHQNNCCII